jgi:ATP-dependent DNA ligase
MRKTAEPVFQPQVSGFVEPMQCLAVDKLPEGPAWEYEVKFDGYRALGSKSGGHVSLLSRRANDLSKRFASLATALARLPDETTVDGEVVALDGSGRPSFNVLQNNLSSHPPLEYYVFDLLHLAGRGLLKLPLIERRQMLR